MISRHKSELRAGLFVNLGVALLMVALFFFGSRLTLFWTPLQYDFLLDNAHGLITGSKVFIAGIDAGGVNRVSLDPRTNQVLVVIDVAPKYREAIRQDSYVELTTQGVLGDRVVMITPGSPGKASISPGGRIAVRRTSNLSNLIASGDVLLGDLDQMILNFDRFTSKLNSELRLKKASDAFEKLDKILGKLNDGQGTLGALLNDPSLYDDAKALAGEANSNRVLRNLVRKSIADAKKKG